MATKILSLGLFSLAFSALLGNCDGQKNATDSETVILVSIAGLGWKFVGSKLTHTPNFNFVAETGVKAKNLLPVNPTRTAPIHTTFLTGLYPESHGIVDNLFWDPVYKEKFIHSDDCSNFDPKFYNESEPLWLTMEKQGKRTAAYFWPASMSYGDTPTYHKKPVCYVNCGRYSGEKLEYLRSYMRVHCSFDWADPFTNRVDQVIKWMKRDEPPKLVLLYIEEPDWKGHAYGPHSRHYRQMIEKIDNDVVGRLIDGLFNAQLLEKVNIIFVSDHSLVETSYRRQIRLHDFIPADSYYSHRGTTEQIWPKPGRLEEIYNGINKRNNSHMKIYKKHEIPEDLHWKNHRRIPPLYIAVEEGWLMRPDYDVIGEGQWTEGSHVWAPSQNSSGIFYARGPAFRNGFAANHTMRAVDLYPLLCEILHVEPLAHNGSLDNVMEFLAEKSNSSRNTTVTPTSATAVTHDSSGGIGNAVNLTSALTKPGSSKELTAESSVSVNATAPYFVTQPTTSRTTGRTVTQVVMVLKANNNGSCNSVLKFFFVMVLFSVYLKF